MSTRDALLMPALAKVPCAHRAPIHGVSLASYLFVEAARLDALGVSEVLAWLGVPEHSFARAEDGWNERVSSALSRTGGEPFDELYEELLTQALSVWSRSVDPLDRDVAAWITFQRHTLLSDDSDERPARRAGLTAGDELRLSRLWRRRLASPEIAARAMAAWSAPLPALPKIIVAPFSFPPALESP